MRLLVVVEDRQLGEGLQRGLDGAGDSCLWVRDGDRALGLARSQPFDAIVMDVALRGRGGIEVLRDLRAREIHTPVLLLAALGSVMERVAGLNAGADDYLVKPVEFLELKARVAAVCRRAVPRPTHYLRAGALCLDLSTRRAVGGPSEQDVELTPTEFRFLEILMRHAGQVVTRQMVCEHVWHSEWEGTANAVDVYVNRLRGKLGRCGGGSWIQTVRGQGYALRVPGADGQECTPKPETVSGRC